VLCGVCCGAMAGAKLNGVMGLLVVGALILLERGRAGSIPRWRALALVAIPALVLALPWYVRCYLLTRDPFHPPLFRFLGGQCWNADLQRDHFKWHRSIGMGRGLMDYVLLPVRVIAESRRFGYQITTAWGLLVPVAIIGGGQRFERRLLGAAALYFVLW